MTDIKGYTIVGGQLRQFDNIHNWIYNRWGTGPEENADIETLLITFLVNPYLEKSRMWPNSSEWPKGGAWDSLDNYPVKVYNGNDYSDLIIATLQFFILPLDKLTPETTIVVGGHQYMSQAMLQKTLEWGNARNNNKSTKLVNVFSAFQFKTNFKQILKFNTIKVKNVKPNSIIPIGGFTSSINISGLKIQSQWGISSNKSTYSPKEFNRYFKPATIIENTHDIPFGTGIAVSSIFLYFAPFSRRDIAECCAKSQGSREGICPIYYGVSGYCDQFMTDFCADPNNKDHPTCACINSNIPLAHCVSAECQRSGSYNTSKMNDMPCNIGEFCGQFLNLDKDSKDNIIDANKIRQQCGAQAGGEMPDDWAEEKNSMMYVYVAVFIIIVIAAIRYKRSRSNVIYLPVKQYQTPPPQIGLK